MTRRQRVGIMPREEFKRRTVAIAKGGYKPGKGEPKIWFESVQSFAQVLSDDNRLLLHTIMEQKPQSLGELAKLTGRKKSNLSRTLHMMAGYGFVDLVRNRTRELVPRVKVTRFDLKVELPRACAYRK